ncbi:hypothetical protein AYO45_04520 [Gammaproteobacteria bacterium SCGC AG-212-F23]|nr:hypothetical protein AYO45_04520 [Gammaproteobacteria bacterium SCGC AG-212-F23]
MDTKLLRENYQLFIYGLISAIAIAVFMVVVVLVQVFNRPLPEFYAVNAENKKMYLSPSMEPNMLPDTVINWAKKAAVAAYTFDFVNYEKQLVGIKSYFTSAGWNDYLASIQKLITGITQNQLFVTGVVTGAPVIVNTGPLPGKDYVWRVQMPFLVTYQSSETTTQKSFTVIITIVKISTVINPAGMGIDQFQML